MSSVQNRRFGAFGSSENPDELAGRVKAIILASSSVIIWAAAHLLHITLDPSDIVTIATTISGAISAIWLAYSAAKAVVIWAIDKWHTRVP